MRKWVRVMLLVCCTLVLLPGTGWAVASACNESSLPAYKTYPFRARIAGDYVAVLQTADDKACASTPVGITVHSISTGQAYTIFNGRAGWPSISGSLVAWAGQPGTIKAARSFSNSAQLVCNTGGGLILFDLRNGQYYVPELQTGPITVPVVWSDYVVYEGKGGHIYCIDMNTGVQSQITRSKNRHDQPDIGAGLIVWNEQIGKRQVYAYRMSTGETFAVTSDSSTDHTSPVTDGKTIVWWGGGVWAYDVATKTARNICRTGVYPHVSDGIVVYLKNLGGKSAVFGYDLAANQEFRVSSGFANQGPAIDSNRVVWGWENRVYYATIKR